MKEALAELQKSIQTARKNAAAGKIKEGIALARQAVTLADGLEGDEPIVAEARGAAYAELGLLLQRGGDATRALEAYQQAEQAVRTLPYEDGKPHYRLLVATTVINLAGLYTKQRMLEAAEEKIGAAMDLLDSAKEAGPATQVLMVGALQNRAALEMEQKRMDAAEKSLSQALEIGEGLVSQAPQLLPQLVEVSGRLAAVLRSRQRADDAVNVAEKAARWAEAAYEAGSPIGVPLYVSTQLQLVDANFAAKRYAQGEDHLWKAVDTAPGPQTLLVGAGFYCSLLRMEDATLEDGDLPRPEVIDALDELLDRMKRANPPAELLDLVSARRAALVSGDPSEGRSLLERLGNGGSPVIQQLKKALASDLTFAESRMETAT